MPAPQSFANHTRWFPLYHFVASPIVLLYAVHSIVHLVGSPSTGHALEALFAIGVAAAVLSSRIMAITVQNRLIRLEMRLRLKEVLPPTLAGRIRELGTLQLIALRFAGDDELPGLVERTLNGEFASPRDIKRAIRDWKPDHMRV